MKTQFSDLISNQNWDEVRKRLKSKKITKDLKESDASNLNCLGLALGYQAPIDIIQTMISVDRTLLRDRDMFGAMPLHVACLNGTRFELIQALVQSDCSLAKELDNDQRTPLHHAVEYACQSGDGDNTYIDVIQMLCQAMPEMVNFPDRSDETPIDLVQYSKLKTRESSADYRRFHAIYCKLRHTSVQVYKENKKRWELEGYMNNLGIGECVPSRASTGNSSRSASFEPYPRSLSSYKNSRGDLSDLNDVSIMSNQKRRKIPNLKKPSSKDDREK